MFETEQTSSETTVQSNYVEDFFFEMNKNMYKYKMKYLFDKSKFTLDSNTNKYVLEFTENFNQPQQLTIHGFHYQVGHTSASCFGSK